MATISQPICTKPQRRCFCDTLRTVSTYFLHSLLTLHLFRKTVIFGPFLKMSVLNKISISFLSDVHKMLRILHKDECTLILSFFTTLGAWRGWKRWNLVQPYILIWVVSTISKSSLDFPGHSQNNFIPQKESLYLIIPWFIDFQSKK